MKKRALKLAKRLGAGLAALVLAAFALVLLLHRNRSVQADVWIDASPQAVWKVLTTTADYAAWNPMITQMDGPLRVGRVIKFTNGSGPNAMIFYPSVLAVRPNQELCWKGSVWRPGFFDGEHRFLLEAKGRRTHFVQSENFTGLLAGRLSQEIVSETATQMQAMNLALKTRVESPASERFPATHTK